MDCNVNVNVNLNVNACCLLPGFGDPTGNFDEAKARIRSREFRDELKAKLQEAGELWTSEQVRSFFLLLNCLVLSCPVWFSLLANPKHSGQIVPIREKCYFTCSSRDAVELYTLVKIACKALLGIVWHFSMLLPTAGLIVCFLFSRDHAGGPVNWLFVTA